MAQSALAQLLKAALAARKNAYAPYSKFLVGACVKSGSGKLYTGCNCENASYPVGQCAEAGAIAAMVAAGEREIAEILVLGGPASCEPWLDLIRKLRIAAEFPLVVAFCDLRSLMEKQMF